MKPGLIRKNWSVEYSRVTKRKSYHDKNEKNLLMIREPLTVSMPCCTKPLSKATLPTQISQASNEQGKLPRTTY